MRREGGGVTVGPHPPNDGLLLEHLPPHRPTMEPYSGSRCCACWLVMNGTRRELGELIPGLPH